MEVTEENILKAFDTKEWTHSCNFAKYLLDAVQNVDKRKTVTFEVVTSKKRYFFLDDFHEGLERPERADYEYDLGSVPKEKGLGRSYYTLRIWAGKKQRKKPLG